MGYWALNCKGSETLCNKLQLELWLEQERADLLSCYREATTIKRCLVVVNARYACDEEYLYREQSSTRVNVLTQ